MLMGTSWRFSARRCAVPTICSKAPVSAAGVSADAGLPTHAPSSAVAANIPNRIDNGTGGRFGHELLERISHSLQTMPSPQRLDLAQLALRPLRCSIYPDPSLIRNLTGVQQFFCRGADPGLVQALSVAHT